MYFCSFCKSGFPSIKFLLLHINLLHRTTINTCYTCIQGNCQRTFQSLRSFRQHLKRHQVADCPVYREKNKVLLSNTTETQIGKSPLLALSEEYEDSEVLPDKCSLDNVPLNKTFAEVLQMQLAKFALNLYSLSSVTTETFNVVYVTTSELLISVMQPIMQLVNEIKDTDEMENNVETISEMLKSISVSFQNFDSEFKRMNFFTNICHIFITPATYTIGCRNEINAGVLRSVTCTGQFISLKLMLQALFKIPNTLELAESYLSDVSKHNGIFSDVHSGSIWKKNSTLYNSKIVIPICLYYDDYETGNALGSHAGIHKLGAVYVSLRCFPPYCLSQLENIFLTLLFHANDRASFGNKVTFDILLKELLDLEVNGIEITVQNQTKTIFFSLIAILGDNLGLNSILGFVECFKANYPCRFCFATKQLTQSMCCEDITLLRNKMNYTEHLQINDYSKTGVKEECIWNELKNFHVTDNVVCDIMHDMLEGVCNWDMSKILKYYIYEAQIFSLETLNSRIFCFDYGPSCSNKPPTVRAENIKNEMLKLSASEMLTFVRYAGVIFGDLIPQDNPVWQLYLILHQIMSIIMSPKLRANDPKRLKSLITEHHELYVTLFKTTLKPKHHHMLHYHSIILKFGPLINLWCMRFESKHKESKAYAHVNSCRKNLTKTIAIKHQLKVCERLFALRSFDERLIIGNGKEFQINSLPHYKVFKLSIANKLKTDIVFVANEVVFNGIKYKPEFVLFVSVDENEMPTFCSIQQIIISNEQSVFFVVLKLETVRFFEHVQGFEVLKQKPHVSDRWLCIGIRDLVDVMPLYISKSAEGISYIVPKYLL